MPLDISQLEGTTIIFGGLTLVSLALVSGFGMLVKYIIKKHSETDKMYFNHTNQVIDRNTDAYLELSKSNQKLIDVIERFHEKIN